MTILNSILPTFAMIAMGSLMKRSGLIDDAFRRTSDRIVYFIFFPALLFWKIGTPEADSGPSNSNLIAAVICAVCCIAVLSVVVARVTKMPNTFVGSFFQASFRFNTYIGIAVVLTPLGAQGVRDLAVIVGFTIPCVNVLCVAILIWFSDRTYSSGERLALAVRAMLSNPLIWACASGVIYSHLKLGFPPALDKTLAMMASIAVPLALLSIGASLTFAGFGEYLRPAILSQLLKLIIFPAVGYMLVRAFGVTGPQFKVAMLFFALPTSPHTYILSSQLDSDLHLASSAIVLSTLLSVIALGVTLLMF